MLSVLKDLWRGVRIGTARAPISDRATLVSFIAAHGSHVAQASLYGYLSKRMGIRWREIFQDPAFAEPLVTARRKMLLACLADLSVFAAALCIHARRTELALALFDSALDEAEADMPAALAEAEREDLRLRLCKADWEAMAGESAFSASPARLVAVAPVTEELKAEDAEIVRNSVRFRWGEPRRQLRTRLESECVIGRSLPPD